MAAPPPTIPPGTPTFKVTVTAPTEKQVALERSQGVAESGLLDVLWSGLVKAARWIAQGFLLGLFTAGTSIIKHAVEVIVATEDKMGAEMRELTALAIQDLFNLPEPPVVGAGEIRRGRRKANYAVIGKAVRERLTAEFKIPEGDQKNPGLQNLDKLLEVVISIAVEGWYEGMVVETASLGWIKGFTELDDTLANVLGLGRLVRSALSPMMEAAIRDPLEKLMMTLTTPKLFGPAEAARAVARKKMTLEEYGKEMALQGWDADKASHLLAVNTKSPGLGQIAQLIDLQLLPFDDGVKLLTDDGWEEKAARLLINLEMENRVVPLRERLASLATSMFGDREITEVELQRALGAAGYTVREIEMGIALGQLLRARPKRLSIGQLSEALTEGLIDLATVRNWLDQEGYTDRDALIVEQLLLKRKLDDEERERRRKERLEKVESPNRN